MTCYWSAKEAIDDRADDGQSIHFWQLRETRDILIFTGIAPVRVDRLTGWPSNGALGFSVFRGFGCLGVLRGFHSFLGFLFFFEFSPKIEGFFQPRHVSRVMCGEKIRRKLRVQTGGGISDTCLTGGAVFFSACEAVEIFGQTYSSLGFTKWCWKVVSNK